jgi:hypothetical protein
LPITTFWLGRGNFLISQWAKKKERTGIIRYQTGAIQQQFAIIKTKRHNRMSPPNLPYNDINLIYIDYNGMGCPKNKVIVCFSI